jgi:hypothetical protein
MAGVYRGGVARIVMELDQQRRAPVDYLQGNVGAVISTAAGCSLALAKRRNAFVGVCFGFRGNLSITTCT